jgi:tRNA modification GTPase
VTVPDTIVALSSPPGASLRAVIRLSGPDAFALASQVFDPLPDTGRRHTHGELRLSEWPAAPASAITFRAPRSYTGEHVVELWLPGAPPLTRRLLLELQELGARLADRGEFTRRAFLNGRLDLSQAEAVLALTTSENARTLRAALRSLAGGVRERIDTIKAGLVGVRAHVEAAIDFSEEEIDHATPGSLAGTLDALVSELSALDAASACRPQARAQAVVALRGPANAGKSTLFNALLGRDTSLVSEHAGTTRDVVEGLWTLPGGETVRLLDTAGSKAADGAVELSALAAADEAAESADLQLVVLEARGAAPSSEALDSEQVQLLVRTKTDLGGEPSAQSRGSDSSPQCVWVSALSGEGLAALGGAVEARLFAGSGHASDLLGSARQGSHLRVAREALVRASAMLASDDPARAELSAVDLAEGLDALGALTGEVTTDDVLDQIFGAFCIGK